MSFVRIRAHALRLLATTALLFATIGNAHAAGFADTLAPANGTVSTQGGRVLHSTTTYAIYWKQVDKSGLGQTFYYEATRCYGPGCLSSYGTDGNYEDRTGTFLKDVGGSAWYGTLSQYWDHDASDQQLPVYNESTLGGTWEDNRNYPNLGRGIPAARLQAADLQAEIAMAVQHNGWTVTPDTLFFVYIPEEVQACSSDGLCTDTTGNGTACGFHDSMDFNGQKIAYALIPSPGDTTGCDATLTSPSTDLVVDNAINATAHELAEAVVDPFNGSGWSDPVANKSDDGGEVGDKCQRNFPGRGSALPDGGDITINGRDYILQSLWSDLDNACTLGRPSAPYLGEQGIKQLQVEDGSPSILVTGHSFGPSATVQWNGTPVPTTYISNQALSASLPAGTLSNSGVATLTVSQQRTGGVTSNPRVVFVIPSMARLTDSTLSTDFAGTTSLGSAPDQLTATATSGSGTLALARFDGNPTLGDVNGSTNSFFEVYSSVNGVNGLNVQDCALNGGVQVDWFDPSMGWTAIPKQTFNPSTHCVTFSIDATTSPSINKLQGAAFGGWTATGMPATPAKPVQQPGSGATASTITVNDTDAGISYKGTGWGFYSGRPAAWNDLNNDVHATTSDGDSVSYTFSGTGIAYVSERSDGYGTVQVALDGALQTVVDANAPGVHNQGGQTLYAVSGLPAGQHTLTLTKTGGAYLLLDSFVVQYGTTATQRTPNTQVVNDTDAGLNYTGSGWGYYGGRPTSVFDIQNDVHATTSTGDAVSYAFSGTGVAYISEKSDGYGLIDVYVDGVFQTTVDANAPGVHNAGSQVLYSKSGLPVGQHTLKLVKKSGAYLLLDALIIQH
jgi:hypothetical protein